MLFWYLIILKESEECFTKRSSDKTAADHIFQRCRSINCTQSNGSHHPNKFYFKSVFFRGFFFKKKSVFIFFKSVFVKCADQ